MNNQTPVFAGNLPSSRRPARELPCGRRYRPDGTLVPRDQPDAFVHDIDEAVAQADRLLRERGIRTLCVHGDNPHALDFVRELRAALLARGFCIRAFPDSLQSLFIQVLSTDP